MNIDLILGIIATGLPGVFSFWILSQLDIIFYNNNQSAEKTILLASLSVLNIFFSFVFVKLLNIPIMMGNGMFLLYAFVIGIITVIILSIYVYPYVFKFIKAIMDKRNYKKGLSVKSNYKVLPRLLYERPKDKDYTQAYIFDFENNLILEGTIGIFSFNLPEISLVNQIDATTTYNQAIELYKKTNNLDRDVYIDYERKVKMILIHF